MTTSEKPMCPFHKETMIITAVAMSYAVVCLTEPTEVLEYFLVRSNYDSEYILITIVNMSHQPFSRQGDRWHNRKEPKQKVDPPPRLKITWR
jgi:hypothetical protein